MVGIQINKSVISLKCQWILSRTLGQICGFQDASMKAINNQAARWGGRRIIHYTCLLWLQIYTLFLQLLENKRLPKLTLIWNILKMSCHGDANMRQIFPRCCQFTLCYQFTMCHHSIYLPLIR